MLVMEPPPPYLSEFIGVLCFCVRYVCMLFCCLFVFIGLYSLSLDFLRLFSLFVLDFLRCPLFFLQTDRQTDLRLELRVLITSILHDINL